MATTIAAKKEFWFIHGSEQYQLPVPPEAYTLSSENDNQTVNVYKTGDIGLWGPKKLDTITIESFFPNPKVGNKYQCTYGDPWDTVKMINRWRSDGQPIRVMITGTPINMDCLINKFEITEDGGIGDIKFSIEFQEYKKVVAQIDSSGSTGSSSTETTTTYTETPSIADTSKYTVQEGDCLWNIAKRFYNDGSKWETIWNANSPMTSGDPNLIYPGEVITIP